eukprot:TRINITY_DN12415_c1_g1_i1.p1 TRINITY_DN12415_c1_g1~~TRINITY_DN12415_c1_g1_i1.p1  ORF type:complete len:935 (+),score=180.84 TRINITY_DN12415_c1_g1_i1:259-2805(+)
MCEQRKRLLVECTERMERLGKGFCEIAQRPSDAVADVVWAATSCATVLGMDTSIVHVVRQVGTENQETAGREALCGSERTERAVLQEADEARQHLASAARSESAAEQVQPAADDAERGNGESSEAIPSPAAALPQRSPNSDALLWWADTWAEGAAGCGQPMPLSLQQLVDITRKAAAAPPATSQQQQPQPASQQPQPLSQQPQPQQPQPPQVVEEPVFVRGEDEDEAVPPADPQPQPSDPLLWLADTWAEGAADGQPLPRALLRLADLARQAAASAAPEAEAAEAAARREIEADERVDRTAQSVDEVRLRPVAPAVRASPGAMEQLAKGPSSEPPAAVKEVVHSAVSSGLLTGADTAIVDAMCGSVQPEAVAGGAPPDPEQRSQAPDPEQRSQAPDPEQRSQAQGGELPAAVKEAVHAAISGGLMTGVDTAIYKTMRSAAQRDPEAAPREAAAQRQPPAHPQPASCSGSERGEDDASYPIACATTAVASAQAQRGVQADECAAVEAEEDSGRLSVRKEEKVARFQAEAAKEEASLQAPMPPEPDTIQATADSPATAPGTAPSGASAEAGCVAELPEDTQQAAEGPAQPQPEAAAEPAHHEQQDPAERPPKPGPEEGDAVEDADSAPSPAHTPPQANGASSKASPKKELPRLAPTGEVPPDEPRSVRSPALVPSAAFIAMDAYKQQVATCGPLRLLLAAHPQGDERVLFPPGPNDEPGRRDTLLSLSPERSSLRSPTAQSIAPPAAKKCVRVAVDAAQPAAETTPGASAHGARHQELPPLHSCNPASAEELRRQRDAAREYAQERHRALVGSVAWSLRHLREVHSALQQAAEKAKISAGIAPVRDIVRP